MGHVNEQIEKTPKRKPTRLKEYDYSTPGCYFITICTNQKTHLFGEILDGRMYLSEVGKIATQEILKIDSHYINVQVDKYVIMPNHIHMIVVISEEERMNPSPTIRYDIPNVIGKYKASVSRIVGNAFMHSVKRPIWQRS